MSSGIQFQKAHPAYPGGLKHSVAICRAITVPAPTPTKRVRGADDGPGSRSETLDVMTADREGGILSVFGIGKESLAY